MGKMYYGVVYYKLKSKPKKQLNREVAGDIDLIINEIIKDHNGDVKAIYDEHQNLLWKM